MAQRYSLDGSCNTFTLSYVSDGPVDILTCNAFTLSYASDGPVTPSLYHMHLMALLRRQLIISHCAIDSTCRIAFLTNASIKIFLLWKLHATAVTTLKWSFAGKKYLDATNIRHQAELSFQGGHEGHRLCVCACVCMCVHVRMCMMHVLCVYVCMCVCACVCMCVCA
jgi:hypothetical protein